MKRYLLNISFDGTAYHGWQVQPNGITVQQVLNESLYKLLGVQTAVTGCSRTDTGVHARQFACHIDCEDNIPKEAFLKGLNAILPSDIAVIDCRTVPSDFHARYNAKGKTYVYGMYTGDKNPFDERYFLHIDSMPDIDMMNAFAKTLTGTHDFCGFSASGRSVSDTERTISECVVNREGNKLYFRITGNGFLYNMVRILAGTALFVGYRKLPVDIAEQVFLTKDRSLGGDTLPPHGLFLDEVLY
ncbi:MAG: tRNA pseudouridine(38-40) synthase TruA [Clostridia bacterium]|nr:tRNA pseudouridine(38-40) synthase TruA [Clostridia bacterium]